MVSSSTKKIYPNITPETYYCEAHIERSRREAEHQPCCLCGEIHRLRIHAILIRKIRTGEEENTEILIISIYCIRAKKKGWQYTKRILPPFVIPECNIILVNVWRYIALYPDGSIHCEEAVFILGTFDDRTIRKHILLGWLMIEKTNLSLAEFLSTFAGYAQVPELKAGESAYVYLSLLIEEARRAAVRMGVNISEPNPVECYVHVLYVFKNCRNPLKTALNRVFHVLLFFDTS